MSSYSDRREQEKSRSEDEPWRAVVQVKKTDNSCSPVKSASFNDWSRFGQEPKGQQVDKGNGRQKRQLTEAVIWLGETLGD
jgi:hypothetical protein